MNTSALFPAVPVSLAIVAVFLFVVGGLVFYALRVKGDVRAEFSHGSTMFRLEAKSRATAKGRRSVKE
jgi:hypothetical protein